VVAVPAAAGVIEADTKSAVAEIRPMIFRFIVVAQSARHGARACRRRRGCVASV
jgi:hypothetical protein